MNKKNVIQIIFLAAFIIILAVFVIKAAYSIGGKSRENANKEGSHYTTSTIIETEKASPGSTADGYYTLEMELTAKSSDGKFFNGKIANAKENTSPVFITIDVDDNEVFHSGIIPLGEMIETFSLNTTLEPGEYDAVLTVHQVKEDSEVEFSSVNVAYKLVVGE